MSPMNIGLIVMAIVIVILIVWIIVSKGKSFNSSSKNKQNATESTDEKKGMFSSFKSS